LIDRYTAAAIQFKRINPEEMPDVKKRGKANLENILKTFESLETWDQILPVKLTVLPENILRHEFDTLRSTQEERVETAVLVPGPETDELAEMARKHSTYV